MTTPDPSSERRERMKQILADSCPRVPKAERKPLPEGVLAELRGDASRAASPAADKASFWSRLATLFRGPQLMGAAAAAVLILVAVVVFLPEKGATNGSEPGGGGPMRSPVTDIPAGPLVVVHSLSDEQLQTLRSSLVSGKLAEAPTDGDLSAFLEERRRPELILVDGDARTITLPFHDDDPSRVIEFDAGTDLETVLLDLLSELAQESPD